MLKRAKTYLKAALDNALVRPVRSQLFRLEKQQQRLLNQVNQVSRHLHLPVAHSPNGLDRFYATLVWDKLFVIDYACEMMRVNSFADLGGAWCDYEGGYSFYLMEQHRVPNGFLVDGYATDQLRENVARYPGLRFIQEDFSQPRVADQIGHVDVLLLFDVLYVQANPGWQSLLETYAPRTRCMLISNVHYNRLKQTLKLMDLGEDEYFKYVPGDRNSPGHKDLFAKLDEIHPEYKCRYRDCHHYWQWAMTDADLVAKMSALGFRMHYSRTIGKRDDITEDAESRVFAFFQESLRLPCR
jgi:hypothetical protein